MPRDVQFLALISDLKAELSLSTNVAVGVDYLPVYRRALRKSYRALHRQYKWPHLHRIFPLLQLSAGQRFYDLPDGLDYDRLTDVVLFNGSCYTPLRRGISSTDFSTFDSNSDVRSDPAMKWDVQSVDGAEQIEVWPIPASNGYSIQFSGYTRAKDLVNDIDTVDIDSDLVILFAAAALLPAKDNEAAKKLTEAKSLFAQLRADAASPSTGVRYGMGQQPSRPWHPNISVAATGTPRN